MRHKKPLMPNEFWFWLDAQLESRGWNDTKLAQKAKITHSVISKARSAIQPIGFDACKAIAQALDVADVLVLRKAGLIKAEPNVDDRREQLLSYYDQLNLEDQDELIQMALLKVSKRTRKATS